jgi:hypothetical protein
MLLETGAIDPQLSWGSSTKKKEIESFCFEMCVILSRNPGCEGICVVVIG